MLHITGLTQETQVMLYKGHYVVSKTLVNESVKYKFMYRKKQFELEQENTRANWRFNSISLYSKKQFKGTESCDL